MKYLIDTCVLLWVLSGDTKKLGGFIDIIMDPENQIYVSIASYWEIAIKHGIGRISIDGDVKQSVIDSGFSWLGIELRHIDSLKTLPYIHSDPFDRLLVAQSKVDNMKLITTDSKVLEYLK